MSEISRAETAAHRQNRMTGRLDHPERFRLLNGQVVPEDAVPLRQPAWQAIVAPGPKPKPRPEPTGTKVVNLAPFSGMNRANRRQRMQGLGLLGSWTAEWNQRVGDAFHSNVAAKRAMRANRIAAETSARYEAVSQ